MSATIHCEKCGNELPSRIAGGTLIAHCPLCGEISPAFKRRYGLDDDDRPYHVHDDSPPMMPCGKCGKSIPDGALICNHCGFNQETGEKIARVYDVIDKEWETGLPFHWRFGICASVQALALGATILVAVVDGGFFGLFLSWLIGFALFAFVFGTYSRVNVKRNRLGNVRLTKTWRVCFYPLQAMEIRWKQFVGVSLGQAHEFDFLDWTILFLLAPAGIIPAVIWWVYVIGPDQWDVALTKDHGYAAVILYRGHNDVMAKDMVATIRKVTGLSG